MVICEEVVCVVPGSIDGQWSVIELAMVVVVVVMV